MINLFKFRSNQNQIDDKTKFKFVSQFSFCYFCNMKFNRTFIKHMLFTLIFMLLSCEVYSQKIACGESHSLVICKDSTVWAWGANESGQLGNGTFDSSAIPIQVQGLTGIVAVACGAGFSFAIKSDGTLWGWGDNDVHQLGIDSVWSDQNIPVLVPEISNVKKIYGYGKVESQIWSTGAYAIDTDGNLWGWGMPLNRLFGDSGVYYSTFPIQDTILQNVVSVGGGGVTGAYGAILLEDGTVWGWGDNRYGQLGIGSAPPNYKARYTQVKDLTNVKSFSSFNHSLAIKEDGSLWAWGYNSAQGRLGDSTTNNRFEPVRIKGIENVKTAIARANNSYAIKEDGTLWAWGWNNRGQLGDGTITNRNYPVPVNGLINVVDVAGSESQRYPGGHVLAVTSDGKLWAWGYNNKGQLGDGTMTDRHTPVLVQGICEIDVEVNVSEVSLKPVQYAIYPNPATHTLHIDFITTTPSKIELLDLQGRTLYTQSVSTTQTTHEISLTGFSTGVYFVKLYSDEGVVLKKIVKE
jgi:alpha-tubulin suppressor-like RCC1 family protein